MTSTLYSEWAGQGGIPSRRINTRVQAVWALQKNKAGLSEGAQSRRRFVRSGALMLRAQEEEIFVGDVVEYPLPEVCLSRICLCALPELRLCV